MSTSPARLEAALREVTRPVSLAGDRLLPVRAELEELFPGGGLRRGSTVAVGSTSLALSVVAGPSAAGSWCAVVGLPTLGVMAAAEAGVVLDRLVLVPHPGKSWPAVTAALLEALDVVVVRPPLSVRAVDARRLVARARERSAVLMSLGTWEGADLRLVVKGSRWHGLGQGHGHLRSRQLEVVAEGRGVAARPHRVRLLLPAGE